MPTEYLELRSIRAAMLEKLERHIVKKDGDCWLYNGVDRKHKRWKMFVCFDEDGKRHDVMAHQLAYILWRGDIPKGLCVCHTCDRPACCNPDHLFLGTPKDNRDDMVKKGRQARTRAEMSGRCKLTSQQINEIRQSSERVIDLAVAYKVSKSTISEIQNRKARLYDGGTP